MKPPNFDFSLNVETYLRHKSALMKFFTLAITLFISTSMLAQTKGNIEACEYDPIYNRFFVSNDFNILMTYDLGDTWEVFGDGSANYGMEVMGNTLFAIKNFTVYGYDLASGDQVMSILITGSQFLNGMGSDGNGHLYVSDFSGNRIYEVDVTDLNNPSFQIIADNVSQPNGIVIDNANNRGVFVSWGPNPAIKAFDLDTYTVSNVATGTGLSYCDGIDMDPQGNFFVSSWQPVRITKFNNDFSTDEIVSVSGLDNPADISYGLEVNILGIANSGNSQVTFVDFSGNGIDETTVEFNFDLFPNPVDDHVTLTFELERSAEVTVRILNVAGKVEQSVETARFGVGPHSILIEELHLSSGLYFVEMSVGTKVFVERLMIN